MEVGRLHLNGLRYSPTIFERIWVMEMNLWLAETENSRAECATILNTVDNFMSSQDSKPLLSLKQDAMTGGYVLTDGIVKMPKHTFFECVTADYFDMEYIFNKFERIKQVHEKLGNTQKIKDAIYINKGINDYENKLNKLKEEHSNLKGDNKQTRRKLEIKEEHSNLKKLIEKLKQEAEDEVENEILYTGHSLFSMILPDDFEYIANNGASKDGKPVVVTRGVLISGTLDKMAIGSSSGSLIHHIAKDYGYKKACDFVSYYQILINNWLIHHGYTISLDDCIPKNTDIIESEMNRCLLKAVAEMRTENDEELLENKITGILNEATTVGQKIAKESLDNKNNMVRIILSGAKGNFFNITQVTGAVGQQNVNGNRIVPTCNGRTLPHYKNYPKNIIEICEAEGRDPLPILKEMFESRGFVKNSYFKGLTPQEYFFHAAGGREGVLDTALKSVTWETEILILENGVSKVVKIGEWIDEYIKNTPILEVENHKERDMELVNIKEGKIFISTVDEDGKVSWSDITAITRHDPGNQLYKITTLSGKQVIVTESKSLLVWEKDTKKMVHKSTPDVKVGDFVPVTMNLQEPPIITDYVDMSNYLPKNKYIYGTDFHKAVNMLNEEMNKPVRGNDIRTKVKRGWWESNNNKSFSLPYPNKSRLQRAISGRSKVENIKEGYIYPYDANREERLIPEMFPLTKENGIFIGLFLAEGNTDGGSVRISNNNEGVITFVKEWFSKHLIKYDFEDRINNIGGRSISVRGSSMLLSNFLNDFLGKGSYNKYIPNEAFTSSNEFIIGLLNGYFSGDGSIYENAITASSASKKLIDGISSLCSRLGIFCKLSKNQLRENNLNTENISPSYTISIRAQWASIFSKKIDLIDTDKNIKLKNIKPTLIHRNFNYQNDVVLDKIVNIELVDPKNYPKVYDLTVPKTLNFCLFNNLGVADTANTGYIQRKMIKMVEDLKFGYTGVVTNSKDSIIEFMYGEDNMDASRLIKTTEGLSFVDINHLNDKLNADIEW
jgi:hypothetical protein